MNSGMRIYEPIVGIEGVAAGGTATVKVPNKRRHMMIRLIASATIAGNPVTDPLQIIESVTTMVGGKEIRNETAEQIAAVRTLNALPTDPTNALTLYYAEPWRADVLDEVVTAWDTFGTVDNFILKVKFKSGLVNPALRAIDVYDASAIINNANGARVRQILKRVPLSFNLGSTGDIVAIPLDFPIQRIYLQAEAGKTIDEVKVTVNDTQVIHELTRVENKAFLADYGLNADAFSYPLLFDVEEQVSRRLEGIRSLTVRVKSSASQTVNVLVEYMAPDFV
jgi:hypothetical protein